MPGLRELLEAEPLVALALTAVLAVVVYWQRRMPLSTARRLTVPKQLLARALDPLSRRTLGLRLVSDKTESGEFVTHLDAEPMQVAYAIHPPAQPNLTSNVKVRRVDRGRGELRQSTVIQLAIRYEDAEGRQRQTHGYFFRAPGGGTDAYAHVEDDTRNPSEHLNDDDHHAGDVDGKLTEALVDAGLLPPERRPTTGGGQGAE